MTAPLVDPTGTTKGVIMHSPTIHTTPTAPVSHSAEPGIHGHRTGRRRALVAVMSAAVVAGSISFAAQAAPNDEFDTRCAPTGPGSADTLERQAQVCQAVLDDAYDACMRTVAGTPDSAERWVGYCRAQALG